MLSLPVGRRLVLLPGIVLGLTVRGTGTRKVRSWRSLCKDNKFSGSHIKRNNILGLDWYRDTSLVGLLSILQSGFSSEHWIVHPVTLTFMWLEWEVSGRSENDYRCNRFVLSFGVLFFRTGILSVLSYIDSCLTRRFSTSFADPSPHWLSKVVSGLTLELPLTRLST